MNFREWAEQIRRQRAIEARLTALEAGGGGGGGGSPAWSAITGKPTAFPPEAHTHAIADVTGLQSALDGKAAVAPAGIATVTVPNNRLEWQQTVAAVGVTPSAIIVAQIAPHDDADENDPEMLDVAAMSARAGTNEITFTLAFATPAAGPVKLAWRA